MAKFKKILFSFLAVVLFTFAGIGTVWAGTEDSVSVTSIDYDNLTLTIQGNGDKAYYFSDYRQKKWEKVVGSEKNGAVTMDISWIPVTKNYVLALKGDESTKPVTVTLPKYNTAFKVVYDKETGQVTSYKGIDSYKGNEIQWRVKGTTKWHEAGIKDNDKNIYGLKDELDPYINEMAAVTVYFRTKQQEGNGTDAGQRPSKEAAVTIAKKTAAPAVTLNGSSMYLSVPAGVEYRVVGTGWPKDTEPTKTKETKLLSDFNLSIPKTTDANPEAYVAEFRKAATAKAQVSASKFIYVNPQQSAEEVGLKENTKKLLSPTKVEVRVPLAEGFKDLAYEYTVSEKEPDVTSKWVTMPVKSEEGKSEYYLSQTFSSGTFSKEKNTKLYVRAKASGKSGEKDLMFASACYVVEPAAYPGSSRPKDKEPVNVEGIQGSEYGNDELTLDYIVDIGEEDTAVSAVNVEDTVVSAVNVYEKDKESVITTIPKEYFTTTELGTGAVTGTTVARSVQINKAGMTALLADKKLSVGKEYTLGIVLANEDKIMNLAALNILSATQISGNSEFKKIAGFDKDCTVTLDFGNKNPEDYNVKLAVGSTYIEGIGEGTIKNENGKYTQAITFTLKDEHFVQGSDMAEINVEISNKKFANIAETVNGLEVKLEQPIIDSDSGSISFTKGNCPQDKISLGFTLNSDSQVTGGFAVEKIRWGETNTYISGYDVESHGTEGTVVLPKSILDAMNAGSDNIWLIINGVKYKTNYKITVLSAEPDTQLTASKSAGNSFRLLADSTAGEESGKSVSIESVDYGLNKLNLTVNTDDAVDDVVFYSTNKKTWYGIGDAVDGKCEFNISWAADTKNYTIYFKGIDAESEDEYTSITLPKKQTDLKVKFDKTSSADAPMLTVVNAPAAAKNADGSENAVLEWRKKGTYAWNDLKTEAGKCSLADLEYLRVKGGKIIVRAKAVNGTAENAGTRYSKEVTVNIPKRGNAPSVKINVSKMRVNTTTAMEYLDGDKWVACTRNMGIWEIPAVKNTVQANGAAAGSDVTVKFRKAAKRNEGYSKTQELVFPGQRIAPIVNTTAGNEVEYSEEVKVVKKKEVTRRYLNFNQAGKTKRYQYAVVPAGTTFQESTAKWKTVSKAKKVTLSTQAVPGAAIYVRILGTNAKASVPAQLSSACAAFPIPQPSGQKSTEQS